MALKVAYLNRKIQFLTTVQDVALSSGSACTSASLEPSYVLRALGMSKSNRWICTQSNAGAAEDMAHSSLRFGLGRFTTEAEVDYVVQKIVGIVHRLREMSPLWEMVQEGIDISTIDWSQAQHWPYHILPLPLYNIHLTSLTKKYAFNNDSIRVL